MRSYSERRWNRHVKGMRRVKNGAPYWPPEREVVLEGRGRTFAAIANHPKMCSNPGCCGNPRKVYGETRQERKAPTVRDWD